jgi:hypothetical protein
MEEAPGVGAADMAEWMDLFAELRREEAVETDGAISLRSLLTPGKDGKEEMLKLSWVRDFVMTQRSSALEKRFGQPRRRLLHLLETADRDGNQMIASSEWKEMINNETKALVKLPRAVEALVPHAQYSCCPPPLVILLLSIVQAGFYVLHGLAMADHDWDELPTSKAPTCSLLIYNPRRRAEAWRFLSYQFVHVGLEHVAFNIIMQLFVGIPLEMAEPGWAGTARVMTVYMSGVFLGSLGGTLPNPTFFVAGASAGVYALIAAHLATLTLNWKEDGEVH